MWKTAASAGGIGAIVAIAALVITNPGKDAYAEYAAERAITYVRQEECPEIDVALLRDNCDRAVEALRPQLESLARRNSDRQNFFAFSIYRTEISSPLPFASFSREFETVGVLGRFFTYRAAGDDGEP